MITTVPVRTPAFPGVVLSIPIVCDVNPNHNGIPQSNPFFHTCQPAFFTLFPLKNHRIITEKRNLPAFRNNGDVSSSRSFVSTKTYPQAIAIPNNDKSAKMTFFLEDTLSPLVLYKFRKILVRFNSILNVFL